MAPPKESTTRWVDVSVTKDITSYMYLWQSNSAPHDIIEEVCQHIDCRFFACLRDQLTSQTIMVYELVVRGYISLTDVLDIWYFEWS
jgi:hypothetical protein